jgi:hypothetical protein
MIYLCAGAVIGGSIGLLISIAYHDAIFDYGLGTSIISGLILGAIYGFILWERTGWGYSIILGGFLGGFFGIIELPSPGAGVRTVFFLGGLVISMSFFGTKRWWLYFPCNTVFIGILLYISRHSPTFTSSSLSGFLLLFGLTFIPIINFIMYLVLPLSVDMMDIRPWIVTPFFMIPVFAIVGYRIAVHIVYSREEKERDEKEKKAELEKIKKLILETEKIVEDAIPNARDPIVLGGLKILLDQIHILYQDFKSGKNHIEARSKILAFREEARILITSASEKEATEGSENKDNYYDILGINLNASQEDIKKAYRSKLKEDHPDKIASWAKNDNIPEWVKKEANERTKRLIGAYEVLSDVNKRKQYDKELGFSE